MRSTIDRLFLFFLVAIFLFTMTSGTDTPLFPFPASLAIFFTLLFFYDLREMVSEKDRAGIVGVIQEEKRHVRRLAKML